MFQQQANGPLLRHEQQVYQRHHVQIWHVQATTTAVNSSTLDPKTHTHPPITTKFHQSTKMLNSQQNIQLTSFPLLGSPLRLYEYHEEEEESDITSADQAKGG